MKKICSPNKEYDGITAGIKFSAGAALVADETDTRWLEKKGYVVIPQAIAPEEPTPEPELQNDVSEEPTLEPEAEAQNDVPEEPTPEDILESDFEVTKEYLRGLKMDDLKAFAEQFGFKYHGGKKEEFIREFDDFLTQQARVQEEKGEIENA